MANGDNPVNQELFATIRSYLDAMDLGGLFTTGADGSPGGWLWDQISSGVDNQAAIEINLEQTDQFKARYGIIAEMRQRAATGAAVHVPKVAEVREYEQTVTSVMRQAGLPNYMYDSWQDAQNLMKQDLSVPEIEQRLGQAWERVHNVDPAIREAYGQFYGTLAGDAALASTFLDPTKTMANIEKQSRAAYTAGLGHKLGLNLDQQISERVATGTQSDAGIAQGLGQVSQMQGSGIFNESIGEAPVDLTAETTGMDAAVFNSGNAASQIEKRQIERRSQSSSTPGGALRTQRGLTGLTTGG